MSYSDIIVGMSGTGVGRNSFGLPVKAAIDDIDARVAALEGAKFGTLNVSFTSLTIYTTTVSFGVTYSTPPQVFTEIATTSGSTYYYTSRACNITTTGFTLLINITDATRAAQTWSNMPVQWRAFPTS